MPRGNVVGAPQGMGRGGGNGRMGGPRAAGPGGVCKCPSCGITIPHRAGAPCFEEKCPSCGCQMIRE
ncbi:MAG: hypothetical protein SVK08_12310 [Halobacteriota archaeon]|nr:hypothetical protein [Halobacteriota archaeon]